MIFFPYKTDSGFRNCSELQKVFFPKFVDKIPKMSVIFPIGLSSAATDTDNH